jgi:hypothetical protein
LYFLGEWGNRLAANCIIQIIRNKKPRGCLNNGGFYGVRRLASIPPQADKFAGFFKGHHQVIASFPVFVASSRAPGRQ